MFQRAGHAHDGERSKAKRGLIREEIRQNNRRRGENADRSRSIKNASMRPSWIIFLSLSTLLAVGRGAEEDAKGVEVAAVAKELPKECLGVEGCDIDDKGEVHRSRSRITHGSIGGGGAIRGMFNICARYCVCSACIAFCHCDLPLRSTRHHADLPPHCNPN